MLTAEKISGLTAKGQGGVMEVSESFRHMKEEDHMPLHNTVHILPAVHLCGLFYGIVYCFVPIARVTHLVPMPM